MGTSLAGAPALDAYLHQSFDLIQYVADNMAAIKAVADHLTPVEDLVDFRNDVTDLHAKLGLLVEAAELMIRATPAGIGLLIAADAPAQRMLLELGSASLKDEEYFAKTTEFVALSAYVDEIKSTVDVLVEAMTHRVTYEELDAALVPLVDRLAVLEADKALSDRVDQILIELDNGEHQHALTQRVLHLEAEIVDPATGLAGLATQQTLMDARVDVVEDGLVAQAADITTLTTRISNTEGQQTGTTQAIDSLTTRTEVIEGAIVAQSESITTLQAQALDLGSQLETTGTAISSLDTRVSSTEEEQSTLSNSMTLLDGRVVDAETQQAAQTSAIDGLSTSLVQTQDGLVITNESLTALQSSITGTGNLLANSSFEVDLKGWTLFSRGSGWLAAQMERDFQSGRLPQEVHALGLTAMGVPAGDAGMRMLSLPVSARSSYILSGYLAAENCTLRLEWRLYDAAGNQINFGVAAEVTDVGPVDNLGDWDRQSHVIPIPVDAVLLQVQLWVTDCHVASPQIWLIRPMLEEAMGAQTQPSPWVPGVNGLEGAMTEAMTGLSTRLDQTDDAITSQAGQLTQLHTRIGNLAEWRVVTHSGSGTYDEVGSPLPATLRVLDVDAEAAFTFQRGLTLVRFHPDGTFATATRFDTYASSTERANLTAALNALADADAFLLVSQDNHGIKNALLTAAMERCGAYTFATVLGSKPYALRGRGGVGKGGGIENYPHSEAAWIDFTFTLVNDTPKGLGENGGWVDELAVTADAVQQLNTRVSSTEAGLTAQATSSLDLSARLETAETALINEMITSANKNAALVSSTNQMTTQLTDVAAGLDAQGAVITGQGTRLTTVEGTVTSQSSSLTNLQAQVNAIDETTGGSGAAISELDTRVTATEDAIDSQGSAITSLQNSVTSANKIYAQAEPPPTVGGTEGDLWFDTDDGNKPYTLTGGAWAARQDLSKNTIFCQDTQPTAKAINDLWIETDNNNKPWRWNGATWLDASDPRITATAAAVTSLTTRVTAAEGVNTSQATAITALQTTINDGVTGLAVTASAVETLTTRVDSAEGVNTSQATAITSLQSAVNNPTTGVAATASAVSSLTTRVTAAEGVNTTQATSLTSLSTTVGGHTSTITSQQTSINGVLAKAGVMTDVNGYMTGWQLNNNGSSGTFKILASKFEVSAPGTGLRTEFSNGNWRIYDTGNVKRVALGVNI